MFQDRLNPSASPSPTPSNILEIKSRHLFLLRVVAVTASALSVILLTIVIILAIHLGAIKYCFQGPLIIPRNFDNPGVFDDMTPNEFKAVRDFMASQTAIGIVPIEKAMANNSYIFMIDVHIPLKGAVLEYLDRGSVRLKRSAKVIVVRGDLETPRVEEYLVSPLPKPKTLRLARNPIYVQWPIPYTSRPMDQVDYRYIEPILLDFSEKVYHILKESFGVWYHNCTRGVNCLVFSDTAPRGKMSGERKSWFSAYRDVDGYHLHPLGLDVQVEHSSTDVAEWKVERIVYNGDLSYTVSDLINRYNNGDLQRIFSTRPIGRKDELYSSFHRRGKIDMPAPLQGPKYVEPEGRRFVIAGQHVKYIDWDFDVRMRPAVGVQVFDVRFQSERLAYEISLQDVVDFQSGYGPSQTQTNLYLTSWLIGASSFELVRGVDCPDTAVYLSTYHFANSGEPLFYRNVICVFEEHGGMPLRRHYANDFNNGYTSYGGITDHHLVVRNIASIGGTDYIFDYMFHLNGAIQVRVSRSGYLHATYNLPFERNYGNTIYYDVIANVHHYLFHYKIDLDIDGLENRYSIFDIQTENALHPWYPNINRTQLTVKEVKMKREMDPIVENIGDPKYHVIYRERSPNKYNTRRAYRILNEAEANFLLEDSDVTNGAKWARYPVVITKYDDTEDQSSSIFAQNDPWDPVVDFERFVLDNDTIIDEDLVAWVTMGAYHIPHTEDVPSIPTTWHKCSFFLLPFNYFTECPSMSSPNIVHIEPNRKTKELNVELNGVSYNYACAQRTYGPETFYGFRGES